MINAKVIIVYSGKGGVGKTTTTSNIAKALIAQNKKVFILDADVNTPSMPVIFKEFKQGEYLLVNSLGYETKSTIYVTDSAIRSFITESIDMIKDFQPDYVLIDTPPSITDVHINLLDKIKPSGLIIVTQPNALSVSDINRTALFFQEKNVNIIGIIENMCINNEPRKYNWKLIESISFNPKFDNQIAYEENKDKYNNIIQILENLDIVVLENKKRQVSDETITKEDITSLPFKERHNLRFVNLSTWNYIKGLLQDSESSMHGLDQGLANMTTENIGRMLKAFENDEQAYFMVTKAPSCVISLLPGEIGQGTLTVAKSYYGIPRIKYNTLQGEIILFPYEIKPISRKELTQLVATGYIPTKDGRYLPPKEEMQEVYNAFGSRVGMHSNWEELYDNIKNGNLLKINEHPQPEDLEENKGKNKRYKKSMTIGDFERNVKDSQKYFR